MPPPNWQTAGEIAGELFDDAVFGARTRGNLGSVPRSIAASERDRLWRQRDQYISSFVRRAQSLGNVNPNILRDQTQRTLLQLPQPPPRISRPITRTPQETFAAKPVQRELNRYTPPATISRAESEGRQGVPGRARTTSQTRQTPEAAGVGYDMKFFGVPTYGDITKVPASVRSKPGFQANWDARGAAIARSANIITSGERKSAQVEQDVLARQYPGLAPDKRYDPTLQYGQDVNEAIKTGDFGPSADAFRVLTRGPVSASLGVDTAKAFATWLAKEQPGIRTDSDPELLARPFGIFLSQPVSAIYATSTGDTRMPQERPEALNTALTVGDVLLPILAMNGESSAAKLSSLSGAERTAELGRIASRVLSADVLGNYSAMKDAGGPLNMAGGMIGSISSAFAPDTPFSQRIGGAAMLGIGALGGSHMLNGAADRLSSLLSDSSRVPREMVKPPVVDTYQYDPRADLTSAFNEPRAENPKPNAARKPKADPSPSPKRTKSSNKTQVQNEQKTVDPSNARQIKTSHIDYANGENLYETVAKDTSGKPIGVVSWSDGGKDGGILIKHVEVREDMRRQGIASAMYDAIKKDNPDAKIKTFGSRTKEGSAFRKSYDKRNAPELPAPKRTKADAKPKITPAPAETPAPKLAEKPQAKEPWEMTRDEFSAYMEEPGSYKGKRGNAGSGGRRRGFMSESWVAKANKVLDAQNANPEPIVSRETKVVKPDVKPEIPKAEQPEAENSAGTKTPASNDSVFLKAWDRIDYETMVDVVADRIGKQSGMSHLDGIPRAIAAEVINLRQVLNDAGKDIPPLDSIIDEVVQRRGGADRLKSIADVFPDEKDRGVGSIAYRYATGDPAFSSLKPEDLPLYQANVDAEVKAKADAGAKAKIEEESSRLRAKYWNRVTVEGVTKSETDAIADDVASGRLTQADGEDRLNALIKDAKRKNFEEAVALEKDAVWTKGVNKGNVRELADPAYWTDTNTLMRVPDEKSLPKSMQPDGGARALPMDSVKRIWDDAETGNGTDIGEPIGRGTQGTDFYEMNGRPVAVDRHKVALVEKFHGKVTLRGLDPKKPLSAHNAKGEMVAVIMPRGVDLDQFQFAKESATQPRTAKDALADAKAAVQDFKDAPGPKGIKQGKRSGAAMVPLSPQKVEALGRAVKHYIEAGVLTVKEMHERIKADLGDYWDDGLRPHIAKIFKEHMSSGSQAEKPGPESPRAEKSTVKRASTPDVTTQVAQEPLDRLRNDLGMNAVDKKGTRLVDVVNSKIAKDIEAGGAAFAREYNAKPSRGSLTAEETAGIGRAIVSTLDRLKVAEKAVSDHISSGNVDQAAREDVGASLLRSDLAELTLAGHRGGSEWGLSGITRRLELKKDYSTDGILHKLVSAVKRKPTEEEVGKAGALSDKINLSAADIDEAIKAEVDRRVQEYIAAQTAPRSPRGAKNKLFTQSSYDAVIARRKGSRMSSKRSGSTSLNALDIADTATILGYHIEAGIRSFADLAARVKDVIPNATDADIAGIADRVLKEMHESNKRPPPKSKGATIARLKLEVKQITDPTAIEKATKLIEQLKQEPINATPEFWHDRYKQIVGQMREMSVGSRIAEDFLRSGADGIQSPQIRDLRVSLNRLKADADHWIQAHEKEGRTKLQHAVGLLGDVISLPKAFKASIDMSAIGRQGLMLFMANPARARGAFAAQFKAFSKLGAERVLADMQAHRSYDLARESKLAIMDFTSSHLFPAEEEFLSSIAGNIPGIAQSERMYASYLSQLRLDWFDHMVSNIESSGDRVSIKEAKDIAHMINVATGRGTLGKFETSANLIGKLLFSVRFPVSRIQFLLGQPLWKGALDPKTRISPRVAKEIGKLYAQTAIGYATTAVVLGLIGAKVGQDPDKSDYLKLRYGPLGIDLSAGLTKYFVLSNRIATDRMSSYRAQALARGMLAPVSGVAADFAFNHGRNPYKQETIPGKRPGTTKEQDRAYDWWDALELFTPIGADQAVQNQQSGLSSDEQIIGAAADFLGFGSNQYKDD